MAKDVIVEQSGVKFPKPKVLLIDTDELTVAALTKAGWNVSAGTFGRPYKVSKEDGYTPLIGESSLPNHTEQEVVIVDLGFPDLVPGLVDENTDRGARRISGENGLRVCRSTRAGSIPSTRRVRAHS